MQHSSRESGSPQETVALPANGSEFPRRRRPFVPARHDGRDAGGPGRAFGTRSRRRLCRARSDARARPALRHHRHRHRHAGDGWHGLHSPAWRSQGALFPDHHQRPGQVAAGDVGDHDHGLWHAFARNHRKAGDPGALRRSHRQALAGQGQSGKSEARRTGVHPCSRS